MWGLYTMYDNWNEKLDFLLLKDIYKHISKDINNDNKVNENHIAHLGLEFSKLIY